MTHFNTIISNAFPLYKFYPSILKPSRTSNIWDMELPVVRDVNGIVLHAQDNINVANNNISPEIIAIEDFYQESNIQNIILIHWNHNLSEIYDGTLNLIEFPTHSFDFIQHFIQRYDEWNDVNNKTNTTVRF